MPMTLVALAKEIRNVIKKAENDGLVIDDGNVVDVVADNVPGESLYAIREALRLSDYERRFPKATGIHHFS